jgi:hypothetical protein
VTLLGLKKSVLKSCMIKQFRAYSYVDSIIDYFLPHEFALHFLKVHV